MTVDLVDKAERMIEAAVAVTTGRMNLSAPWQARALLIQGNEAAIGYFRHELGQQIGSALLMMDPRVVAVYEDLDMPDSEEEIVLAPELVDPLRVVVHVENESPAIVALVRAIGDGLAHALRDALPHQPREYIAATYVTDASSRRLMARSNGYRPAPALLAIRPTERLAAQPA
ncbi:MAG TPA: hypothetical protein VMM78_11455 [Thermomicrobiales bacterium]|nr:hypothetical protein [Thermomicrobiales bacterium]